MPFFLTDLGTIGSTWLVSKAAGTVPARRRGGGAREDVEEDFECEPRVGMLYEVWKRGGASKT